jgi:hypothetical protein
LLENMRKLFILLAALCLGCIDPYEFAVENNGPSLVVEGSISDVSYNETLQYPSNGRYFNVKLSYTSDVTNAKGTIASNARVYLEGESGQKWTYTESLAEPGIYFLLSEDFETKDGMGYKLKVTLPNEETYESDWERLPPPAPKPIGEIGFEEVEKQVYVKKAGEQVVETIRGINVYVEVPKNEISEPVYYRWQFDPMWIYIAPFARSSQPDYKCWVSSNNYLPNYTLQTDNKGGYRKNLFFLEINRNERVFEKLSVLVVQQSVSEANYYFWKEMQDQISSAGIFDTPPFNLQTNLIAIDNGRRITGYFSVVNETAGRWYFNKEELSYGVPNTLRADCAVVYGPGGPAASCIRACLKILLCSMV